VRMLRALAFAARLGFTLDPPIIEAIAEHRELIATASPARLIEEFYKVLRSGAAEKTFRLMAEHGMLATITPELHRRSSEQSLWQALAELDTYRQKFDAIPQQLTNPILLGTLLVPLGLMPKRVYPEVETVVERPDGRRFRRAPKEPPLHIGMLPVARRDTERLRQILSLQRRLIDLESTPRTKRALVHRGPFQEALVWLEIHGHATDALEHWRGFIEAVTALPASETVEGEPLAEPGSPLRRRRSRRRRGRRRGGSNGPPDGPPD
jgi:poly(A) polymerase